MSNTQIKDDFPSDGDGGRSPYWDNLKGILIVLVVFGHILWEYNTSPVAKALTFAIYTFHMPAFIFVSGYLSQGKSGKSAEANIKILIWFLALNIVVMPYAYYVDHKLLSPLELYYSSWYLLALFLYRTSLPLIRRLPFAFMLSLLLSILVGYAQAVGNTLQLQKIIAFFPFFVLGATSTPQRVNSFLSWSKRHLRALTSIAAGVVLLVPALIYHDVIGYDQIVWTFYKSSSDVILRIVSLVVAGIALGVLLGLTTNKPIPLITQWGRNSLSIYITHRIVTLVFARYFPALASEWVGVLLLPIAALMMLLILGSNLASIATWKALEAIAQTFLPFFLTRNVSIRIVWIIVIVGTLFSASLIYLNVFSRA